MLKQINKGVIIMEKNNHNLQNQHSFLNQVIREEAQKKQESVNKIIIGEEILRQIDGIDKNMFRTVINNLDNPKEEEKGNDLKKYLVNIANENFKKDGENNGEKNYKDASVKYCSDNLNRIRNNLEELKILEKNLTEKVKLLISKKLEVNKKFNELENFLIKSNNKKLFKKKEKLDNFIKKIIEKYRSHKKEIGELISLINREIEIMEGVLNLNVTDEDFNDAEDYFNLYGSNYIFEEMKKLNVKIIKTKFKDELEEGFKEIKKLKNKLENCNWI